MTDLKPVYLFAGGRSNNNNTASIFVSVLKDIGKTSPTIAYVGAANGDNRDFMGRMGSMFSGAGDVRMEHAPFTGKVDVGKSIKILEGADAVFVSGGDVEAGMTVLEEKRVTGVFQELYRKGKLFFGISAGSIMLAKEWVRWPNPDDDSSAELFRCLGVAPIMCDTHGEGDDWEELKAALVLKGDNASGFGITSGTCLKVSPDGKAEAVGGAIFRYSCLKGHVERQPDILP